MMVVVKKEGIKVKHTRAYFSFFISIVVIMVLVTMYHCNFCNEDVPSNRLVVHSRTRRHKLLCCQEKDSDYAVYIIESAFKRRIISYRINGTSKIIDPKVYMLKIGGKIEKIIKLELQTHKNIKINVELFCTFVKTTTTNDHMDDDNDDDSGGGQVIRDLKSFNTKNVCLQENAVDFPTYYEDIILHLSKKMEEFQERDSGWALEKIEFLDVNINKCEPLRASSYIPLPKTVQAKKACVNIKNSDDACFLWAVTSALYPADKNCDRVTSYPHYTNVFNLNDIKCPVSFKDINKFERLNKLSVNVYGIDSNNKNKRGKKNRQNLRLLKDDDDDDDDGNLTVVPLRISKVCNVMEQHVNLLYYECGTISHYCWIKQLSRLVRSQITKFKNRVWLCDGCLHHFTNEVKLKLHHTIGCGNKLIQLPTEEDKFLKFKNFSRKMKVPFVIYADFESILMPIDKKNDINTYNTHKHVPCSFAYYIHCEYDEKLSKFVMYRGEDCVKKFVEFIYEDAENIAKILATIVPPMKTMTTTMSESGGNCHICEKPIDENQKYVIDHCHLTGKIRGKAHGSCNINYKLPQFIPTIFHNLSGYDSHLFIKELAKSEGGLNCIPHNKEKYISFDKKVGNVTLRFIDSFKFMSSSLEKLVKNLSHEQFKILPRFIPSLLPTRTIATTASTAVAVSTMSMTTEVTNHVEVEKLMKLLTRKGVYPYEYVSDWSKLQETSLPSRDDFYNKLTDSHISDADYQHAEVVWCTFSIKTLGEYCDLYLKTDVLLLTEVFENFRQICIDAYELDPCQYVTAPGLSWDAMLKYTKVELELFTDYEMVQFIKAGIRGGISQASKRYAKANNQFMKDYDAKQDSNFIIYLDVNNLYGDAMRRLLPINNFRWASDSEIKQFDITTQQPDSDVGYILEVDLEYPQSLHNLHNDYPFCAETRIPSGGKIKKLLLTLENKNNYVTHYINLKQSLEKGVVCKKIHRILIFNQSTWLKSYIDLNSQMRAQAKNSFEKDFFKLMNNSIFGKTIENVENRVDVRFCNSWNCERTSTKSKYGLERYISKPNFHSATIFSEDLVAVQLNKTKIVYDKPIYTGFAVLELSKYVMYSFHYDYMLPKYGDNMKLLYTDTDSFIYDIKTEDFYQDIKPDLEAKFDTSDFPKDNVYSLPLVNKKVVGMMKDENNGRIVKEFIALRSKMYAYILNGDDEGEGNICIKKNKGVNAAVVRKLNFEKYHQCLDLNKNFYDNLYNLISDKHNVFTQIKRKKILCGRDEKRFIMQNGVETLAWGHCRIPSK